MKVVALLLIPLLMTGCVMYERDRLVAGAINPVSVEDVIAMTRARVNELHILGEIRANGVLRSPSADDIVAMKEAGVSDAVIQTMIGAPVTTPRKGVVYREVYYDTRPAEDLFLFGLGAIVGYNFFRGGHVHHSYGYHHRGVGRW